MYVGYLTNNDDDERTGVTLKQEVVNENGIGPTRGRLAGRKAGSGPENWMVVIEMDGMSVYLCILQSFLRHP